MHGVAEYVAVHRQPAGQRDRRQALVELGSRRGVHGRDVAPCGPSRPAYHPPAADLCVQRMGPLLEGLLGGLATGLVAVDQDAQPFVGAGQAPSPIQPHPQPSSAPYACKYPVRQGAL